MQIHPRESTSWLEAVAMMAWLAIFGLTVVVTIAVGVGAALDTEAQRRESNRLAAERRARTARDGVRLCDDCPFRDLD